ncbi:MAG: hypothetical protein ACI9FJ_001682 [Alteromonadaceae bacterium]|jgi:hypothetical protein
MSKNIVLVDIQHSALEKKSMKSLSIIVKDELSGKKQKKAKGNSPIHFHNNTLYKVLIWVSRYEDGSSHDWEDLIKGSESYVDGEGVIGLSIGTSIKTSKMKIRSKDHQFSLWVHVKFKTDPVNGFDGGGLSESAEIVVTP